MAFKIGMVTLDCGPTVIQHDSGRARWAFSLFPATVGEAKALRHQLTGLTDPATSVVPVTWDDDTTINGFYRVERVTVDPFPVFLTTGAMQATIELVWLASRPYIEARLESSLRTNTESVTDARTFFTTIDNAGWLAASVSPLATAAAVPVIGYDGAFNDRARLLRIDTLGQYNIGMTATPEAFYLGSCFIEWTDNGTDWYTLIGRRPPNSTGLRFSNGRLRFTLESSVVAGETGLRVEIADDPSGLFVAGPGFTVRPNSIGTLTSGLSFRTIVMRNTPEMVTIRYLSEDAVIDVSIRRGAFHADINVGKAFPAASHVAGYYLRASSPGATISGGVQASANDSNGLRWALFSPNITTKETATFGGIRDNSETSCAFFYGTLTHVTSIGRRDYFGANSIGQRVVT